MGKVIKHILAESLFFRVFILFIAAWTYLILSYDRADLYYSINDSHSVGFDAVMPWITRMGEAWLAVPVLIGLFFWKVRYGVMAVVAFGGATAITQVLKRWVFDAPRPSVVFEKMMDTFQLTEGVELHSSLSFPSGHTTSAFAVFCLLSLLLLRHKYLGFVFAFLAIMVGFSRCYLFQHFPEDVLFGSIIGTVTSMLVYSYFSTKSFGEKGILNLRA